MDVNEAIMEYKMDPNPEIRERVEATVTDFEAGLKTELTTALAEVNFEEPEPTILSRLKDNYLKSKYLRRLRDNLSDTEAEI